MAKTENLLTLAKLGLKGNTSVLVEYIEKLAVESSNEKKHTLSKELKKILAEYYATDTLIESSSMSEISSSKNRGNLTAQQIWIPDNLKTRIEHFISVHEAKDLPPDLKQAYSRLLFYGPPGSGKTTLGYYISQRLEMPMVYVKVSDVISSKFGETTRNIADIFAQPGKQLIFLDEFDAFGKSRFDNNDVGELKRIVNSLIQTLDFASSSKIVLGATNLIDSIDPAIVRRFNLSIKVDKLTRAEIESFINYLTSNYLNIQFKLKKPQIKELLDVFATLDITTVDAIKNVFEHTIVNTHLASRGQIFATDIYSTLLTSGYLEKTSLQRLSKNHSVYKNLMNSLSSEFNTLDISSYSGLHRNSITNYKRKTTNA